MKEIPAVRTPHTHTTTTNTIGNDTNDTKHFPDKNKDDDCNKEDDGAQAIAVTHSTYNDNANNDIT
jgi:hypothetical protein